MLTRCVASRRLRRSAPRDVSSPPASGAAQNRGAYGQGLPPGYDSRTARKPVQRRVVDFTSTVARNLQARLCRCPERALAAALTPHARAAAHDAGRQLGRADAAADAGRGA